MTRMILAVVLAAIPIAAPSAEPADGVQFKVHAMAAPKPVLKYQLLPEVRELKPGNPAQWYIRCFAEQFNFFFTKFGTDQRERLLALPLKELAKENESRYGGNAVSQADWAARLDAIDWQVTSRVQTDGLDMAQPDLASLRILGRAIKARFRAQIAERRFDDAVGTAKTMLAMARHLGEHPTEEGNQIGLYVLDLALSGLEEMIQQPGSPNLYWALTDLPSPIVNLRKGFQGAVAQVDAELRAISNTTPMTDAQIDKVVARLAGVLGFAREQAGRTPRNLKSELAAKAKDPQSVFLAELWLRMMRDAKISADRFPPMQVVLLGQRVYYESRRDEQMKLLGLTYWQIEKMPQSKDANENLFSDFVPQVVKAKRTLAQLERRMAILQHIEALRMYARSHEGRLPEKLADAGVPLPLDPLTGKPFEYKVDGKMAQLGAQSPSEKDIATIKVVVQK